MITNDAWQQNRKLAWSARRVLCDWQMPECVPEVRLDAKYFVDQLVRMGVKSLLFTAQSAHGNCLYPSKVGYTNRIMQGDIFGEVCRRAKDAGLEFIAYYNQTLNILLEKEHPGWQQVQQVKDLQKPVRFESYPMFCMNCAPYRELVFRQMEEIAGLYAIDGFMLDLNYFGTMCFCRWCRAKFKARYGYALDYKTLESLQHSLDYGEFRRDSRREFTMESMARCRAVKPELTFTWNHCGDISLSQIELDAQASYAGVEGLCSVPCKWIVASGKSFEVWISEGIGSWGDWTVTTAASIKAQCSVALAHGGAACMNHVAPPCGDYGGRVAPGVYDLMSVAMQWVARREKLCLSKRSVPVMAVLHSVENTRLAEACGFQQEAEAQCGSPVSAKPEAIGPMNSVLAATLLKDLQLPVDFIFHEKAMDNIGQYEAVLIPNMGYVPEDVANRLRAYVAGGGKLIATYNTSLLDARGSALGNFTLADLFGADFKRRSAFSVAYLDDFQETLGRGLPDLPILVRMAEYQQKSPHRVMYCKLRRGARALACFAEPILESDWDRGYHIYHDKAPPGKRTRWPAVILNRYGKGLCAFLPFPLLQSYERHNIWLLPLAGNLLRLMGASRRCQVQGNPAVEVVLKEDAQGWLLHLLHLPVHKQANANFANGAAPSGPVTCRLRPPWPAAAVEYALGRRALPFARAGRAVVFKVPEVHIHKIIRIRRKER